MRREPSAEPPPSTSRPLPFHGFTSPPFWTAHFWPADPVQVALLAWPEDASRQVNSLERTVPSKARTQFWLAPPGQPGSGPMTELRIPRVWTEWSPPLVTVTMSWQVLSLVLEMRARREPLLPVGA